MNGASQVGGAVTPSIRYSGIAPGQPAGSGTGLGGMFGFLGDLGSNMTTGQSIGAGLRLGGTIGGAIAARDSARASAAMSRANAALARDAADLEASRYRRDARARISAARAQMGTTGVDLSSPSFAASIAAMARREEENAALIEYRGKIAEAQSRAEASYYDRQGDVTLLSGITSGVADVMPRLLE